MTTEVESMARSSLSMLLAREVACRIVAYCGEITAAAAAEKSGRELLELLAEEDRARESAKVRRTGRGRARR
jgi:hypothetical protein